MTLIKSISGIRGTIGGHVGEGLTPVDAVLFSSAFAEFIKRRNPNKGITIAIGRDARISGPMVNQLVTGALVGMGVKVIDLGLSTTPTVEMAVPHLNCDAGIILTASHNPKQWNALKLLNEKGEFISGDEGQEVLRIAEENDFHYADVDDLGSVLENNEMMNYHLEEILKLDYVDVESVRAARLKVVCDCVNSSGGIFVPELLKRMGVEVIELFCEPNGEFPHNPEPLPQHLTEISNVILKNNAHFGVVVDPDVDRLAMVCEDGSMFGEEYTLVAVADHIISMKPGNTVSNMSSTRALSDVTRKHGGEYFASAVGEVNVVEMMKAKNAVIGGEGNGGVILPELHYGRDALAGIAMFLTHYVKKGMTCSALRDSYPKYAMSKQKIQLTEGLDVDGLLNAMATKYADESPNLIDGVKIDFPSEWVHLRKSNTEPIIRVYAESSTSSDADALASRMKSEILELV